MNRLKELLEKPLVKNLYKWKMAICQHPMYLLIDEDRGEPIVGERVPPWGAEKAADYVERVKRNLASLEKFPGLKLNYQFSGVEMDSMARDYPEAVEKMRQSHKKGGLDFIGGSFSQPHFQILGPESNWRQFELGHEIFKRLFKKDITLYARQETGLHQQLPQILAKFGYRTMMVPPFPWAMEIFEGKMELTGLFRGVETIREDEFVEAVALDGTALPLYLKVIDSEHEQTEGGHILGEISKSSPNGPPIWTLFPDMIEIDEKTYNERIRLFDFVLLEPELEKRLQEAPPRAKVRIYTFWSYTEGVWAEELLRMNKKAEEETTLAEGVYCQSILGGADSAIPNPFRSIWYKIMKYQHHDVSWIEVTDLRRKGVETCAQSVRQCQGLMEGYSKNLIDRSRDSAVVFNILPSERRPLVCLEEGVPGCNALQQKHGDRIFGFLDLPAGGYASFNDGKQPPPGSQPIALASAIHAEQYDVILDEKGLLRQLNKKNGTPLLNPADYLGGEIRAMIDDTWFDNREAACRAFDGPVARIVERQTTLGTIPLKETYFYFKQEPLIKVELDFEFSGNEVGYFWLDETKINVYYPTSGPDVYHDIPFGYLQGRDNRTLFATNWIYSNGLVYVNRGTPKHWTRRGLLANALAWGGRSFTNRLQFGWAEKNQYDLLLHGKHRLEYYLMPVGEFDGNRISQGVQDYLFPVFTAEGSGQKSFYQARHPGLWISSVHESAGKVHLRGYQLPIFGKGYFRDWEIFDRPVEEICAFD